MTQTLLARPTQKQSFRWSVAEYERLGELGFFQNQRVELIRGEIINMSPMHWPHVVSKVRTADELRRVYTNIGWVNEQAPLPMILADSEPEPDIMVVTGKIEDYQNHPIQPLLVVEVSDSTLDYDLTVKCELYAEAGMPQYWVIDVNARCVHVFGDPVELAPGGFSYREHRTYNEADLLAPLIGGSKIQVKDLFAEVKLIRTVTTKGKE